MNSQIRDLTPNPIGPYPPLPDPLPPYPEPPIPPLSSPQPFPQPFPSPQLQPWPPSQIRSLRCGCYLIEYKPVGSSLVTYDGTMRIECNSNGRAASGDLYQRPLIRIPWKPGFLAGIPCCSI